MERYLAELNEAQKEAATTIDGPVLILAGAGTGKTKTITTRLAYLLSLGVDPRSTLTLTFTNKAAQEMRFRALGMIGVGAIYPPELFTFHKFGLLFLRFHIERLKRKSAFVIIDSDDKRRILKQICGEAIEPKVAASSISRYKNAIVSPEMALTQNDGFDPILKKRYEKLAEIYRRYDDYLEANNLVDFDDLLLLPYLIMRDAADLKESISKRYQFVMVDEYQDTNELQFQLLRQLCSEHNNLCVVGDDDQSIYGWRGANVRNILGFCDHFEAAKVVKLETNYRSTPEIIKAANELIGHNRVRYEKRLKGALGSGEAVRLKASNDESEEALFIANEAKRRINSGASPKNIAVLFRINALSRALEEGFAKARVPFRLVDSVGFYERAEIKDAIAYLRLAVNPDDDFSARRAMSKPRRGVGDQTQKRLSQAAADRQLTIMGLLENVSDGELETIAGKKAAQSLREFESAMRELSAGAHESAAKLIDRFESLIGLRRYYGEKEEIERALNLDELYGLARDFSASNDGAGLVEFLSESALASDQDAVGGEVVNLMTVHAAKGLEFDHVFVVGLEEGFFPLTGDTSDVEEERRLGYVAFTRAKKSLTLCSAQSRFFHGKREIMKKSRFLAEAGLTSGCLTLEGCPQFKKGDLVKHKLFGMGRVMDVAKSGKEHKLTINFGGARRDILSNFVERI
ncbi:MAG: UvrD-helicase domain-containing protein [Helicobacteraceae bacterium]|jgi:DNA helicase-2/ATP-dependent DNA helicase PcrA|nr:UvrD-helicase domain-containing protein [Helicobacteraceae bacterium]